MINGFILGAAAGLKEMGIPIYIESVPMDFKRPCLTLRDGGTEIREALGGYIREEISLYVEYYDQESFGEGFKDGKNFRIGEAAGKIINALNVIEVEGKHFRALKLNEKRKSQVVSGATPSNVEGFGGLLEVNGVYGRFIKAEGDEGENAVMERLFEEYTKEEG